jgi:urea carboxylase
MREYHAFLQSIEPESAAAKRRQQAAFDAERARWAAAGTEDRLAPAVTAPEAGEDPIPAGCRPVCSPVAASVWNVSVESGQRVEAGQKLLVLEAMKMEIAVSAPSAGVIEMVNCSPGALVSAGQRLVTLRREV